MLKVFVKRVAERLASQLVAKYNPKIVAVTGSVGKTTTKAAVAAVLSGHFKVLAGKGNFNVDVVVPLQFFGVDPPANIRNPFAWLTIFAKMKRMIQSGYDYEVVVVELGADKPGDITEFARYIHPDINVVTAIAPEHMEFFKTIETVAQEELALTGVSKLAIINRDDIDISYDHLCNAPNVYTYGTAEGADYQFRVDRFSLDYGFDGKFFGEGLGELPAQLRILGEHNIKPAIAAVAVAAQMGMPHDKIAAAVADIEPVNGRMNLLRGAEGSVVIDDSYNSSPLAAKAALKTLYEMSASTRIAVLGSMNELGEHSASAHTEVGEACDPKKIDLVVTVGEEAENHLAPAAKKQGCQVESFLSPYDAGAFVRQKLRKGAVVLVKGSQGGIFTEEVTKLLLADPADEKQLVRQSPYWQKVKHDTFRFAVH